MQKLFYSDRVKVINTQSFLDGQEGIVAGVSCDMGDLLRIYIIRFDGSQTAEGKGFRFDSAVIPSCCLERIE